MTKSSEYQNDKQLIALDLDGTVLDSHNPKWDGKVSNRVIDAVLGLLDAGHFVAIATGRNPNLTADFALAMGLDNKSSVCSNGSCLVKFDTREKEKFRVKEVVTFNPRIIVEKVSKTLPSCYIAIERFNPVAFWCNFYNDDEHILDGQIVKSIEEIAQNTSSSRLVLGYKKDPGKLLDLIIDDIIGQDLTIDFFARDSHAWLDISPHSTSKATGLETLRQKFNIDPQNTTVFGDGLNDVPMFNWASTKVAMDNGRDGLKAMSDFLSAPPDQDGVAPYLEDILKNGKITKSHL